jgi:hypothetical protein
MPALPKLKIEHQRSRQREIFNFHSLAILAILAILKEA